MAQQAGSDERLPIGEFSRRSSLTIHQLRHYHEVGLLEPSHVDSESGYRYYSPVQIQTAELIAILRSLDMPLAEIRQLLRNPSRSHVTTVLDRHRLRLEARFADASVRLQALARLLKEGRLTMQLEMPREVVEVGVDGVRLHVPSAQHVVVLAEKAGGRNLPVWIGMAEATAIGMRLAGTLSERPLTHDLLASCLAAGGLGVRRVTIWQSADEPRLYLAAIELAGESTSELVDARPSDAINVALRTAAPIFVAAETLARAGVARADAQTAAPDWRTPVRVLTEEGGELATVESFEEPEPGFKLSVEFELTEVVPLESGAYQATARPVAPSRPRVLHRPMPSQPEAEA
jgi:bifunctional DNase/RNase/DNA-binding transcriptional MerR regulator